MYDRKKWHAMSKDNLYKSQDVLVRWKKKKKKKSWQKFELKKVPSKFKDRTS